MPTLSASGSLVGLFYGRHFPFISSVFLPSYLVTIGFINQCYFYETNKKITSAVVSHFNRNSLFLRWFTYPNYLLQVGEPTLETDISGSPKQQVFRSWCAHLGSPMCWVKCSLENGHWSINWLEFVFIWYVLKEFTLSLESINPYRLCNRCRQMWRHFGVPLCIEAIRIMSWIESPS